MQNEDMKYDLVIKFSIPQCFMGFFVVLRANTSPHLATVLIKYLIFTLKYQFREINKLRPHAQ